MDIRYILSNLKTEQLLNILPENLIIAKDSGSWNICEDNANMDELYHQDINESFRHFIIRSLIDFLKKTVHNERLNYDICLSSSDSFYCV